MFGDRTLIALIEKLDGMCAAGAESWFGCYSELVPQYVRFHALSRNSNVMVRTKPVWATYQLCSVNERLVNCIQKVDATIAFGLVSWLG
jgi:hypothetical protein